MIIHSFIMATCTQGTMQAMLGRTILFCAQHALSQQGWHQKKQPILELAAFF